MRAGNKTMQSMQPMFRWGIRGLLLGSLGLALGCGDSGPPEYHVSGTVTHGGDPIPAGSVSLIPDTRQGNSGPAVSIEIRNGQFDSRWQGAGHQGGPFLVRITGLDGQRDDEFFPKGVALFPDYELELELPAADSTQAIEVPGDWVMPPQAPVTDFGP